MPVLLGSFYISILTFYYEKDRFLNTTVMGSRNAKNQFTTTNCTTANGYSPFKKAL